MKVVFALLLALVINLSMAVLAEDKVPIAGSIPAIPVSEGILESVTLDEGAQDSEALLDGYVQRMIDSSLGQSQRRRRSSVGAGLEGVNKVIYDLLKTEIQLIADGTHTSTAFEIPVSTLIEEGVDCGPWSAEDLGVGSIINSENRIDADAAAAAFARIDIDVSSIIFALKADFPYEMYWYGNYCEYGDGLFVSTSYDYGLKEYFLSFTGSYAIDMLVSQDFADESDEDCLTVDPSRITTAKAAIKKAQSIVAGSSGNVFQRITAYKDAICREVSYNDAAAGGGAPYGNPWQLIWVFDDDPSTKVVCEGYSKAFKYLVDLSNFGGSYDCILVTGLMAGGSGSGPHMWNLMRMDDGRNYLVDVTNCDEGTVGAPGELFMAYGPTGAWNDQYTFTPNNSNIVYKYDDEIIDAFGEDRLTVSATAYHTSAYGITVDPVENGTIQADAVEAAEDDTVTLTVTPAEGYAVDTLSVVYCDGTGEATITPEQDKANPNVYTFAMPGGDVTVRGTFRPEKTVVDSGTCGANLTWELDDEGTLTISGTGEMWNYNDKNVNGSYITTAPWGAYIANLKAVVIESGVTSIGDSAFCGCSELTSVSIPEGVTSIGNYAFRGCSGLTSVSIPEGVTNIGSSAFYNCSSLTSVSIPESVTGIGDQAFYDCDKLSTIELLPGIEFLGEESISPETTIQCYYSTYADKWAKTNGYTVEYLDDIKILFVIQEINILCGDSYQLMNYIDIAPAIAAEDITWISSDPTVVSVKNGVITTLLPGEATITARFGDHSASTKITVIKKIISLTDFTIPEDVWLVENESVQVPVTDIQPEGADLALLWASSDISIVQVNNDGVVTGNAADNDVMISARDKYSNLYRSCMVHICHPVTSVEFADSRIQLNEGDTVRLTVNVTAKTRTVVNRLITFASDDEDVVTVDEDGNVTAVGIGMTTITATAASGVSDSIEISVLCVEHTPVTDPAVAPTCTGTGLTEGSHCEVCGAILTAQEIVPATGHEWGEVSYNWADDKTSVTATRVCGNDETHVEEETVAVTGEVTTPPTCTEKGKTTYSSAAFENEAFEAQTKVLEDVDALGHDLEHHGAQAATCTEKGWNAYDACKRCDYTTYVEIVALGHDLEYHDAQAATCTAVGWKAYDACKRDGCGYTTYEEISALGHDLEHHEAQAATCTEKGWNAYDICKRCDYTTYVEIVALGHDLEQHEAQAATCTAVGWKAYNACKRDGCGYTTYEEISALGHDLEHHEAQAATCTEKGWNAYDICKREGCGYTTYAEISALGHDLEHHDAQAATCTEKGWDAYDTCKREGCGYTTYAEISALGHDLEHHNAQAATCTEKGWNAYDTCKREGCGYTTYMEIQATGHQLTSHAKVDSTCTATGTEAYWSCDVCHKLFSDENAANEIQNPVEIAAAHQLTPHAKVDSTCTATGTEAYWSCDVCHKLFSDENAANEIQNPVEIAASHQLTPHAKVDSTCTATGTEAYWSCDVCQKLFSDAEAATEINTPAVIGVKAHTLTKHDQVDATCTTTGTEAYWSCDVCQKLFSDAEGVAEINAPAVIGVKAHTLTKHDQVDATCTATGTEAYWSCDLCQKLFSDAEAATEINVPVVIGLKAHTLTKHDQVDATCSAAGTEAYWSCDSCQKLFSDENALTEIEEPVGIDALGHTEVIDSEAVEPTCTKVGHSKASHCSVCQAILSTATEIPAKGHTAVVDAAVEPTCTKAGKTAGKHCSVCNAVLDGNETVPAKGHTAVVDAAVAPTCTKAGKNAGKHCSVCNAVLEGNETIPAKGHTEVVDAAVAPTCTKAGLSEGKHCSVCNTVLVAQNTVPATGHTEVVDAAVAPTCTKAGLTEGKHCSVCNAVLVAQEAVPATGHTEVIDAAVAPTCTEAGKTAGKHCSVCGAELVAQETVAAKGHSWGAPAYEWAADNSAVTARRVCGNDGAHVESETVNTTAEVTFQATTTQMGQTTYTARFANGAFATQTRTVENIPMLTPTVEPTSTPVPEKVKITECKFTVKDQTYTGKALQPAVKITYNKAKLKKDTDYTVAYKNNINIGVATVTIKGKGNYTGTKKLTFNINPKGTAFTKLTGGKQQITLKWKNPGNITGYEIEYSLEKDFSGSKTVKIKKAKTLTTTIKKLKAGATYYVRIRTCTTVKKKSYYSAWSKTKTVKTKGAKSNSGTAPLEAAMNVGETLDLKALLEGSSWESSDETVATVSEDGIVKALAEGEVVVTALNANEEQMMVVITVSDGNVLELDDVEMIEIDDGFGEEIQMDEELELTME